MGAMKTNLKLSCIMLLAVTLVLFQQGAVAQSNLFRQVCKKTVHHDLCMSIIESDPRDNLKNSANGLCTILRDKALSVAKATTTKISNFLKKETNLYGMQCLQDCISDYEMAVSALKSADFTYINNENYPGLNGGIAGVSDDALSCEECFTERPGTPPCPITPENTNLDNIAVTILDIINLKICNQIAACT